MDGEINNMNKDYEQILEVLNSFDEDTQDKIKQSLSNVDSEKYWDAFKIDMGGLDINDFILEQISFAPEDFGRKFSVPLKESLSWWNLSFICAIDIAAASIKLPVYIPSMFDTDYLLYQMSPLYQFVIENTDASTKQKIARIFKQQRDTEKDRLLLSNVFHQCISSVGLHKFVCEYWLRMIDKTKDGEAGFTYCEKIDDDTHKVTMLVYRWGCISESIVYFKDEEQPDHYHITAYSAYTLIDEFLYCTRSSEMKLLDTKVSHDDKGCFVYPDNTVITNSYKISPEYGYRENLTALDVFIVYESFLSNG